MVPKLNALKIGVYAHTGNRPTGKFFADNGSKVVRLSKSSGDTIRVQYQGSLFGGIERIKAKLIDFPQTITDLDSVVVRVPGQIQFPSTGNYGLPPQFLKGQLERESSFRPQFRWEPFAETKENIHRIGKHGELSQYMNNYLYQIKSNTELGNPGIPLNGPKPGHSNVQIYVPRESISHHYWGYQGTIWELLSKTSKIINPEAQYDIYEKSSYAELKEYEKIRQKELQDLIAFTDGADENSDFILALARASADFWLRHTYQDGRINSIAQTRTATSYGFLQPRYTTAVEKKYGYPKDASHRPEDLQIPEIVFKYAVPYLTIQLKEVLDTQNDNDISNWNLGWEKTWKIALSKYNNPSLDGISGYGIDVINKSSSYKPH